MSTLVVGELERPKVVYTLAEINPVSTKLITVIDRLLQHGDPEMRRKLIDELPRCQVLSAEDVGIMNGTPALVIFDQHMTKNFRPVVRGMRQVKKQLPSWAGAASMFGIAIGDNCDTAHGLENCASQIVNWFWTDRFSQHLNENRYPWGAPPSNTSRRRSRGKRARTNFMGGRTY